MTETQRNIQNPVAFQRLMRLGRVSYAEGDYKQAHDSWQEAAMLQPDSEEVWEALLRVLTAAEDRRVCLRNILTINPHNKNAQALLDELVGATQPPHPALVRYPTPKPRRRFAIGRFILRLLESAFIGTLIALGLLVVRFLLI
jgi:tetratricopeptide (TPR) repeat protein